MSDFVPRDMLPDLWEEILKRHWTFLDTEESIQKLEERKKLEGCLKEFLCIVPHDRKFFLPETAHVLRKSIREMDDFTAYKAIIGFESISQYANNLFTKPWRKEFRVLKMYSGFFQHEIKSNLLDAERLFEAMGYRRISDDMLVLDGPICPDQVTNVSRDAMAAYVECQIMKHIYAGLVASGLTCSWQDIFHYREKYVGGTSQSIKGLAYAIQERRLRKEKLISTENCYATIQHSPQASNVLPPPSATCQNCAPYHLTQQPQHAQLANGQCPLHHNVNNTSNNNNNNNNNNCTLHPGGSKLLASYPAATSYQQNPYASSASGVVQPHMSHSRSLEHYNEPPGPHLPHRHSFDHQQQGCTAIGAHHYQQPMGGQHLYESPYDCLDGVSLGSSASYAAVVGVGGGGLNAAYAHPYNVSGNRYPLPYNISSQLQNSHYATPTTVTCNGIKGDPFPALDNGGYATVAKSAYPPCSYHAQPQPQAPLPRHNSATASGLPSAKELHQLRTQRSYPPLPGEQLIDFDDRAPLASHDFHALDDAMYERRGLPAYAPQPKESFYQATAGGGGSSSAQLPSSSDDMAYGNYVYARPMPRGSRMRNSMGPTIGAGMGVGAGTTDKYLRNAELNALDSSGTVLDNNRKSLTAKELKMNGSITGGIGGGGGGGGSNRKKLSAAYASSNERDTTSDLSYESNLEDFVNVGHSERPARHLLHSHAHAQRSPTQATKNQDGVGSFESWDYVFQNLERSGYSKDLGERGDLLVQSLDLDSLNLANGTATGTEKRRSTQQPETSKTSGSRQAQEKSRTLEKGTVPAASSALSTEKRELKSSLKQDKSILKQHNSVNTTTNTNTNTNSIGGSGKKTKSALKTTATTTTTTTAAHDNNNGNATEAELRGSSGGVYKSDTATKRASAMRTSHRAATSAPAPTPASTSAQLIVSSPNEWSCRFCTFLNPDTKRICEMCCRSKDFNLEAAAASKAPTCV